MLYEQLWGVYGICVVCVVVARYIMCLICGVCLCVCMRGCMLGVLTRVWEGRCVCVCDGSVGRLSMCVWGVDMCCGPMLRDLCV